MPILITVVTFALIIFALVDLIMSDETQVKHLPKMVWLIIIILLPIIGSIIWLAIGKHRALTNAAPAFGGPSRREPGRHEPVTYESTTEAELAALDREIAFHEKQAEVKRLEALLEQKRQAKPPKES